MEHIMAKTTLALAAAAVCSLSLAAFAADNANQNGTSPNPQSSTAPKAAPASKDASPGTVGGMKDAGGGSFTASEKDQKKSNLKDN